MNRYCLRIADSVSTRFLGVAALGVLMIIALFLGVPRDAQAGDTYEELVSRYQTLRNTDVKIRREPEWTALIGALEQYQQRSPKSAQAPDALFRAAILAEQMHLARPSLLSTGQVIEKFDKVVELYSRSEVADDAALRAAQLLHSSRGLDQIVRKRLAFVLANYPKSDSAPKARDLLHGSQGQSFQSPKRADSTKAGAPVVVLDPGHGGEDKGAQGIGGILEKDIVLDIALRLEQLLVRGLGANVRLTRRKDEFVPLALRTQMANDLEADLFISLHTNASPQHTLSGFEVYYLDTTDDKASALLAERENMAFGGNGPADDLSFMLSDLIQSGKLEESILLARDITGSLKGLHPQWKGVRSLGVKKGPFYVLVGAHMPCVLVELFFIDHRGDGALLGKESFRQAVADRLFRGVKRFLARSGKRN